MPNPEFYARGLRFDCTECGNCCSNQNGYDYVYLTLQDVRRAAEKLGLSRPKFRKNYVRRIDGNAALKNNGEKCVFLKRNGHCRIYEARPLQCRTFPFWPENLNRKTWKELASDCPGIGQGKKVAPRLIQLYLAWDRADRYNET